MGNISILVITDDREYGRALGYALIHLCSQIFVRIMGKDEFFDCRMSCRDRYMIPDSESVDIIMWDGEEAETAFGGRIVLLSEKQSMAAKDADEGKYCIYKYSQVQAMIADIFEIYTLLTGNHIANINRNRTEIFSFVSCGGGTGCTTLSMSVAQELCRFCGKRVMYLSFEEFESTGDFIDCPANIKGAGTYLYHLLKPDRLKKIGSRDGENTGPVIDSHIVRSGFGMETFAPGRGRNPLKELTADEMGVFISSLTDCGRYDVIIMDIGSSTSAADLACMEISEKICFVTVPEHTGVREDMYIHNLICRCGENIVEKMVKAENMSDDSRKEKDEKGLFMPEDIVRISRSSIFLQGGETKKIFLDGEYGNCIKVLTERLTESGQGI